MKDSVIAAAKDEFKNKLNLDIDQLKAINKNLSPSLRSRG
jgi:hypothetical protein